MRHVTQYGSCFARFGKHSMLLYIHACMLVSPARRRSGLDSTGRGVAPAALNVVRSGRRHQDNQSSASARTHPLAMRHRLRSAPQSGICVVF